MLSIFSRSKDDQSPVSPKLSITIRWMIRPDITQVLHIENESFDFPWTLDDLVRHLRNRDTIGMVAEHKDEVVGYMVYHLGKHSIDVLNFAVDPNYRRRGVGIAMAEKLAAKLSDGRRKRLSVKVRETNLGAQLFFKRCGFRATAVLRDVYEETREDAYLMVYRVKAKETAHD
jgi:ribosomal-protein-alanine N-acetyltransferase